MQMMLHAHLHNEGERLSQPVFCIVWKLPSQRDIRQDLTNGISLKL